MVKAAVNEQMILTVVNMIFLRWCKYLIDFETMYSSTFGDIKQFFAYYRIIFVIIFAEIQNKYSEWNDSHFYTFQFDNKVVNQ